MLLNTVYNIGTVPSPPGGSGLYEVTVASGTVSADLADFPLMIDLYDMPTSFWNDVQDDGGNIRAYSSDGVSLIPHDVTYINTTSKVGRMFVKTSLLSASDNIIHIGLITSPASKLSVGDTNGRNAVWSDYKSVMVFPETDERTGNAWTQSVPFLQHSEWCRANYFALSGSPHQGLAGDGTNFWTIDTNEIRKTDLSWATVASDLNVTATLVAAAPAMSGIDHLGDGVVVGNYLYLTVTRAAGTGGNSYGRFLVKINKSDLSYADHVEITDSSHYVFGATVCFDGTDLVLFSYTDGSKFVKYDPDTLTFTGEVAMSSSTAGIQGSTVLPDGTLYISEDKNDTIIAVEPDGTVLGVIYKDPQAGINEGLHYAGGDPETLYLLNGDGLLMTLTRLPRRADFRKLHSAYARIDLDDVVTTWTIGGTVYWTDGGGDTQEGFVTYINSTNGVSHMYDDGPDRVGIWTPGDSWLHTPYNPAGYDQWRGGAQHVGTSTRSVWVDGSKTHDAGPVQAMPGGSGAASLVVNNETLGGSSVTGAYYQHIWLRYEAMSDAWMAADAANMNDPGSFYSIVELP